MVATVGSVRSVQGVSWLLQTAPEVAEVLTKVLEQGPPTYRKTEDWKYTDIRTFLEVELPVEGFASSERASTLAPEELCEVESIYLPQACNLVFVDGIFSEGYSDAIPSCVSIEKVCDGEIFSHFSALGVDYFSALAFLYARYGVKISVDGTEESIVSPVHCIFYNKSVENPKLLYHQIYVGDEKKLEVWMSYLGSGKTISLVGCVMEERSQLHYRQMFMEGCESSHINHTIVVQKEGSNLQSFQMSLSGKLTRSGMYVTQEQEAVSARVDSLYAIRKGECVDFAVDVLHKVPNTMSRQLCKGILLDAARFIYRSKIQVSKNATDTDAHQENKNLLLGSDARVDARPQLDILHDAVQCAHGSAVGQLDEEQLFYLRSRSIGLSMSKKILIQGFAQEVYRTHPFTSEQQLFLKKILELRFFQYL